MRLSRHQDICIIPACEEVNLISGTAQKTLSQKYRRQSILTDLRCRQLSSEKLFVK